MGKLFLTENEKNSIRRMYGLLNEADKTGPWYDGDGVLHTSEPIGGGGMYADRVFKNGEPKGGYPAKVQFAGGLPVLDKSNNPIPVNPVVNTPAANANVNPTSPQQEKKVGGPSGYISSSDTDENLILNGQKLIGVGSSGELVKNVQQKLSKKYPELAGGISKDTSCATDKTKCDGIFGKNSKLAAAKFQQEMNLKGRKNGIIGKVTYPELMKIQ